MTDCCLINPNNRTPAPFAAIEPPFWLSLIAYDRLKQHQEVMIVDAEAEGLTIEQTVSRVNKIGAKENIIVVMGNNPSVSSTPKMVPTLELLKCIEAKLVGLHPNAMKCPNTIVKPFEGFPHVRYDLLPMGKYRAHNWHCLDDLERRNPYGVLYTSLNCPFHCYYCNVHSLYGQRGIKYRKIGSVLHDIYEMVYKFKIRNIKIWDELFTLNPERVNDICEYIISADFDLNIWAYARVDTVNEVMLKKMKKAGVNWLCYGFESSSERIRKQADKHFHNGTVDKAIAMTREAGINIIANFLFGLPGETMDDMQATLDMAMRENFEYANFYVALPYPGSKWYASLKTKPTDWSSFSQFAPNICADPKIVKFRGNAFRTYFTNPAYLDMIIEKFGIKAQNHIKEMVRWQIRK